MRRAPAKPESWLQVSPAGLYCVPADLHIDPVRAVARAVISHGHGDHARPGHNEVLATAETLAIMRARYGEAAYGQAEAVRHGTAIRLGEVELRLVPAGHILGSAQVVLDYRGSRVVVSGDYKRRRDPTCPPFEPVPCDVFITEATFGLPVFRHPPDRDEIGKLLHSLALFPERTHLVGVYALGKCQRLIALLREAGWDRPIYLHGALSSLCALYEEFGVSLGPLRPVPPAAGTALKGELMLAPPSSFGDGWAAELPDPVLAMASGWMGVRARARQWGVELPLVLSDHADWDELLLTARELAPARVWVTHGRAEALVHALGTLGLEARALDLVDFEAEA